MSQFGFDTDRYWQKNESMISVKKNFSESFSCRFVRSDKKTAGGFVSMNLDICGLHRLNKPDIQSVVLF
jgi:hypothetical protein